MPGNDICEHSSTPILHRLLQCLRHRQQHSFPPCEHCKPCKTGEAEMPTWVLRQSLLQPAGRDAHAGDAPPQSTENLQRIQTLGQRPRVDANVLKQAFNCCTKW